ncbi:MAG: ThiF family adenylyltransferase [Gemmatimonadaceae bacterium]|nr:ThiF family adenylyltransferase [Gemmatimonadaceae bacterium]
MTRLTSIHQLFELIDDAPTTLHWRTVRLHLSAEAELELTAQCATRNIALIDALNSQIVELARVRFPAADALAQRTAFEANYRERLHAQGSDWMYFHWNRRLVRVLPRDDYFDVVTNRNQDKITRTEQEVLRNRVIGVVGLSVGGEIAVTVAQEHLCGRIKLADFDTLDLSNLNRLGASVEDLGVNKGWLVARRIAALNPWLEVEVFAEGLTEQNADPFLDGLDLVIDECDGLAMKFRLREMARERRLNLVFAADERGMLSVEPYAHTDLALFHGLVTAPHGARSDYPDDQAYFRALSEWLGGWDRLSERSRASLVRIGHDLAGYPQLAGEPRLAAGQVAHVARRLLLGERLAPFFGYFDLEEFPVVTSH